MPLKRVPKFRRTKIARTGKNKAPPKKKAPAKKKIPRKKSPYRKDFEVMVGVDVYKHWIDVLKKLVPYGRTHRLSVVVAGMMQYAWHVADRKSSSIKENKVFSAIDAAYDDHYYSRGLVKIIASIFEEAGVKSKRVSSRGVSYSIAEEAADEYSRWDNMPWE